MVIEIVYEYKRVDGGITVSPNKPDCEYKEILRLVADKGKILTNGDTFAHCIDTDTADGWTEIDDPNPSIEIGVEQP